PPPTVPEQEIVVPPSLAARTRRAHRVARGALLQVTTGVPRSRASSRRSTQAFAGRPSYRGLVASTNTRDFPAAERETRTCLLSRIVAIATPFWRSRGTRARATWPYPWRSTARPVTRPPASAPP